MSLARSALLRASRSKWLAAQMSNRAFARRAVKKFMPGEEVTAALDAAPALAAEKIGTVITQLGENLTTLAEADAVRDHYLGVLDTIKARGLTTVISVKPTQLGLDLSEEACFRNIDALVARTTSMVWIDMEDSSYVDRTLALYRRLKETHQNVGVCMQAYLRRTPSDLEKLMPIKPAIRLVKGAYAEPENLAFPIKRDVDLAYYQLAEMLFDGGAFPVFGTHDMGLLERIIARGKGKSFEVHMLYGIRSGDQRALARQGHVVRCLISYGSAWFAWYMRRLAERPANVWFVLKSMIA